MKFHCSAAAALALTIVPVMGQATTAPRQVHDVSFRAYGLMDGSFSAEDLNGDGRISLDETYNLTAAAYNYGSGGGGNWYAELSAVYTLDIAIGSNRFDSLTADFDIPIYRCGYDSPPDCFEEYGADDIIGHWTLSLYEWVQLEQIEASWQSYPAVPLPASFALLLGGLGAFAVGARRKAHTAP
ncbi:VPLPA-CTERM sorting domain-containing protein [Litorivita pollutaquae]|nr:VPLPA-CTERM sorting domain-containing protein [Litorivita pollutaquae]